MSSTTAVTKVDLSQYNINKIASGKVREIFEIDDQTLLFVATDRISAYDVILNNVSELMQLFEALAFLVRHAAIAFLVPSIDQLWKQTSQHIFLFRSHDHTSSRHNIY